MSGAAGVFPLREHDEKKTGTKKNKPAGKPDKVPIFFPFPRRRFRNIRLPNKAGRAARNGNTPLFPAKR